MQENKKKILIIDDDKFLLNMYSIKFDKNGFDVSIATGGADAIDMLKKIESSNTESLEDSELSNFISQFSPDQIVDSFIKQCLSKLICQVFLQEG